MTSYRPFAPPPPPPSSFLPPPPPPILSPNHHPHPHHDDHQPYPHHSKYSRNPNPNFHNPQSQRSHLNRHQFSGHPLPAPLPSSYPQPPPPPQPTAPPLPPPSSSAPPLRSSTSNHWKDANVVPKQVALPVQKRVETEDERRARKKREYEKQRAEERRLHMLKQSQVSVLQRTKEAVGARHHHLHHGSMLGSRMVERRTNTILGGERVENRLKKPTTFICKLK